jgi:hypothetical protein
MKEERMYKERNIYTVLMMEAVTTSETSVNIYQSTRRYNPEGSHLCKHRRENLGTYKVIYE